MMTWLSQVALTFALGCTGPSEAQDEDSADAADSADSSAGETGVDADPCEPLNWGEASIQSSADWSAFCDAGYNALRSDETAFLYWDSADGAPPDCLCEVDGDLSLRSDAGLDGLQQLRAAQWLSFVLEEPAVFPALTHAQRLSGSGPAVSAPQLLELESLSLDGEWVELPKLERVDELLLLLSSDLSLPALVTLRSGRIEAGPSVSLPGVERAEELRLGPGKTWDLGQATRFSLPALTRVDTLSVNISEIEAPLLERVETLSPCGVGELPALTQVGELALQRVERLTLSGVAFPLGELPSVVVSETLTLGALNMHGSLSPSLIGGSLVIQDTYNIEPSYLEGVTAIPGGLSFVDTRTSTLPQWSTLNSVGGDVRFSGNPYLSEPEVEEWLTGVQIDGAVSFSE